MKRLIAKRPILYHGRMHEVGEALPLDDDKMVEAWVKAESAEWEPAERDALDATAQSTTEQLDRKKLGKMKTADLERLAAEIGVDISEAKTNPERASLIAAAIEAQENDGGDA